ncbi:MAG: alpha/beta fold hydrolase [Nannocystaceae bacterium]|nr:alpha/beta fold hydrolase [Nannocystaceae bacterium]
MGLRRRVAGLREARVQVDGFDIPYLIGGESHAGRDVVLIHGFSDTKDSFVDVARILAKTHRVILPDLPGFSQASQPWDFHYSLPAITEIVAAALQRLGLSRAHVVGNSLGGAIAAQYAATYPMRVATLTLIGAAGLDMPVASPLQRQLDAGENPFVVDTYEAWAAFIQMALEKPPLMPGVVRRQMARVFIARAALNEKILADLLASDYKLSERLSDIRAPTLVLWGNCDRFIDLSAGRVYHAAIEGARLVILDRIGHCPQVEAPGRTARCIQTHLDTL